MKTKDFNQMLNNKKNLLKIVSIDDEKGQKKWGGKSMVIAPPLDYNKYMALVPSGKLLSINELRKKLAKDNKTDICCPLTAGIFVQICAWASSQREIDKIPYWRTIKSNGELNAKYPGGIEDQKAKLEAEGFVIEEKGRTNKKYFVKDFEKYLFTL